MWAATSCNVELLSTEEGLGVLQMAEEERPSEDAGVDVVGVGEF